MKDKPDYQFIITDENPPQMGSLVRHAIHKDWGVGIIRDKGMMWPNREFEPVIGQLGFTVNWPSISDSFPVMEGQLLWLRSPVLGETPDALSDALTSPLKPEGG